MKLTGILSAVAVSLTMPSALIIPASSAQAQSAGQCSAWSRGYADSQATRGTPAWMDAFIAFHEPCMSYVSTGGAGGGAGFVQLCARYPQCRIDPRPPEEDSQ